MKKLLVCVGLLFAVLTSAAAAQDIVGQWQGTLNAGKDLRIIVKVEKNDAKLAATMYSIDQQVPPLKASGTRFEGGTFTFSVDLIGAKYEGKISGDGNAMTGTWTQGPTTLPLNLVRATTQTAWEIPPPPKPAKMMAADADPAFEVATIKPNNSGNAGLQQAHDQ